MKKIFFSFLAIAAIASCAKTEDVFTEGESEIKLSPVSKLQTKANFLGAVDGIVYPTQENFDVYAYVYISVYNFNFDVVNALFRISILG